MANMKAVRLIELNEESGLPGNNGSLHVTRSNTLQLFCGCVCSARFVIMCQ